MSIFFLDALANQVEKQKIGGGEDAESAPQDHMTSYTVLDGTPVLPREAGGRAPDRHRPALKRQPRDGGEA